MSHGGIHSGKCSCTNIIDMKQQKQTTRTSSSINMYISDLEFLELFPQATDIKTSSHWPYHKVKQDDYNSRQVKVWQAKAWARHGKSR